MAEKNLENEKNVKADTTTSQFKVFVLGIAETLESAAKNQATTAIKTYCDSVTKGLKEQQFGSDDVVKMIVLQLEALESVISNAGTASSVFVGMTESTAKMLKSFFSEES